MKNFPIRESFEIKINIKRKVLFFNKTKVILLKYKEASIIEIIDFLRSEKKVVGYFSDFILNNSNASEKDLGEILKNFDKIFEFLNETFLKGLNKHEEIEINKETEKSKNNGGFNAYIILLSEKLRLDPLKILYNYTLKQLNYFTEGVVYNMNESSEKGKRENRMNNIKKERENLNNEDAQKIKDFIYSD